MDRNRLLLPAALAFGLAALLALFLLQPDTTPELDRGEVALDRRAPDRSRKSEPRLPPDGAEQQGAGAESGGAEGLVVGVEQGELTDGELDALAKQLEQDPNTHVVCELAMPVRRSEAYLAVGGHSDMNGRRVQIVKGKAYLPLVYDLGELNPDVVFEERSGKFSLDGYGPVDISWGDAPEGGGLGGCTAPIEPESSTASLTGTITLDPSGAPAAGAWIEGCGNMAFADQHGVVHMDIVPEPCQVIAMRQDGLLRTMSEVAPIAPTPGQDVVLDLVIPESRKGGLGVQISQADDGAILIDGLIDGGPAGEAGLLAGDVVVAVDGEPPADLQDFVTAVGGEAGTDVTLTVDRAGEQLDVTVTREVLEQPG